MYDFCIMYKFIISTKVLLMESKSDYKPNHAISLSISLTRYLVSQNPGFLLLLPYLTNHMLTLRLRQW